MCVQSIIDIGLGNPIGPVRPKEAKLKKARKVRVIKPQFKGPLSAQLGDMLPNEAMRWAAMGLPCLRKDKLALKKFLKAKAA